MCLATGHNPVPLIRLEPGTTRSQAKHSTTDPIRYYMYTGCSIIFYLFIFCGTCMYGSRGSGQGVQTSPPPPEKSQLAICFYKSTGKDPSKNSYVLIYMFEIRPSSY